MRRLTTAITLAVLLLTGALPASAGTAASPEITDDCGAQIRSDDNSLTVLPGHVDICAGWFETTAGGLKITLQTSGPTSPEPGFWSVWWDNGDCIYDVQVNDAVSASSAHTFQVGCGQQAEPECSVPGVDLTCKEADYYRSFALPAGSVVRTGNTLQVTVSFTGALAEFAPAHSPGQVLSDPRVWASTVVGPVFAHTMGCTFGDYGTYCFEAGGDYTIDGRDYVVGS